MLHATASLNHFAQPEWQAAVNGTLELTQLSVLAAVEGLTGGSMELDVNGHSCAVSPAVAQTHPRFWERLRRRSREAGHGAAAARSGVQGRVSGGGQREGAQGGLSRTSMCGCTMWTAARSCTSRRRSCC